LVVFAFSFLNVFAFAFAFAFAFLRCYSLPNSVSALVPMAQMKPNSSRATAVVIFLLSLPAAANAVTLVQPVLCLPAISLASSEILSCRLRQSIPNTGWTMIAPRSFNDDSSQMRVACFGDAPARVRLPLELSLGTAPQ